MPNAIRTALDHLDKPGRGRTYDSILETIGNTPLVKLHRIAEDAGAVANIYAKFGEFHKILGNNDCSHSFHKRRSLQLVDFKNLFEDCT